MRATLATKIRNRDWMERCLPPPVFGAFPEFLTGLSDDSRCVEEGYLFIVRTGAELNLDHLDEAIRRRVSLLLAPQAHLAAICRRLGELGSSVPLCVVGNIREATGVVASSWWENPSRQLDVVGVTGTNGKTTSSFLTRNILESSGHRTGLIGTVWFDLGNGIIEAPQTTPGPLFLQESFFRAMENGLSGISMEVSSHALDQDRVSGTAFRVVHFTNLTRDHMDYHKSFEDYFRAKSRLILWNNPDGTVPVAVVNGDDPYGKILIGRIRAEGRPFISYGHDNSLDIHPLQKEVSLDGIRGWVETRKGRVRVESTLPGEFNLQNIMGAIGCALALGLPLGRIEEGIQSLAGVPGRFERVNPGGDFAVIVDYAHTDDALQNILSSLREVTTGRIITVFGCGGDRDRGKRPRMGKVAGLLSDIVVVTSDNPRTEDPEFILDEIEPGIRESGREFIREADRREAIGRAIGLAKPGDAVLIAGKGHESYQVLGKTKTSFDDREVAREWLRNTDSRKIVRRDFPA